MATSSNVTGICSDKPGARHAAPRQRKSAAPAAAAAARGPRELSAATVPGSRGRSKAALCHNPAPTLLCRSLGGCGGAGTSARRRSGVTEHHGPRSPAALTACLPAERRPRCLAAFPTATLGGKFGPKQDRRVLNAQRRGDCALPAPVCCSLVSLTPQQPHDTRFGAQGCQQAAPAGNALSGPSSGPGTNASCTGPGLRALLTIRASPRVRGAPAPQEQHPAAPETRLS